VIALRRRFTARAVVWIAARLDLSAPTAKPIATLTLTREGQRGDAGADRCGMRPALLLLSRPKANCFVPFGDSGNA
jgi:hypothetical protein